jgi:MFS family permease
MFCLTCVPYGVVGAFSGPVMQYKTSAAGIDVDVVGWFQSLLFVPPMVQFLYAPIIDVGPKRKHWLIITASLAAACIVGACLMPLPDQTTSFLVLAVAAQLLTGLVAAANGGLMAVTLTDDQRGAAGAWYNIGNLSGGAVSTAFVVWMSGAHVEPLWIGLALAAMMVAPALAALAIHEPERDNIQRLGDLLGTTFHDIEAVLRSRKGLAGILLCLSPVGTAALVNAMSGQLAKDYGASEWLNGLVNGPATAVLTAVGAAVCGVMCSRFDRRAMYLMSGALTAASALAMAVFPMDDITFAWGVMLYQLVAGFCYAAFTATVLESIGTAGKAASTQYALFASAGNAAISYTQLVDSHLHTARFGARGMLGADTALNLAGVAVLGFAFWQMGVLKWRRVRESSAA